MLDDTQLDPRLNAYRPDLAAEGLRGRVAAARFTVGEPRQVRAASVPVRRGPGEHFALDTEALFGARLTVFAIGEGWAWGQLERDGYVGYVPAAALSREVMAPTHRVSALATFVYPEPDIKRPPILALSLDAEVTATPEDATFLRLVTGGYGVARHFAEHEHDRHARVPVAVAERFIGTPYLWGGRTRLGIDCSGLVQIAFQATGRACPRDSDMQQRAVELGAEVPVPQPLDNLDLAGLDLAGLQRGDLVFWPGHVGLLVDGRTLLHANAHHMAVAAEPLAAVVARQARAGVAIAAIKRPLGSVAAASIPRFELC